MAEENGIQTIDPPKGASKVKKEEQPAEVVQTIEPPKGASLATTPALKKKDNTESTLEISGSASSEPAKPSQPSGAEENQKPDGFFGTIGAAWDELVNAYNTPETKEKPVDPIVAAVKRGIQAGDQAEIISPFSGAKPTTEKIKELATSQKKSQALPASKEYQEFSQADTFGKALTTLVKNPVKIIGELTAESLSSIANYGMTRIAGGAGIGAGLGSVVPGIGTAAGAGSGVIAGLADTSLALEYSSKFIETLQEAGVDMTDPEAIEKAFADDDLIAKARSGALKKSIPIAVFDLISGGIAGKVIKTPAKSLVGKIAKAGAELGTQGALGGGGELAGQLVAGEKIQPGAIVSEIIGELGTAPIEIASNTLGQVKSLVKPVDSVIVEETSSVDPTDIKSIDKAAKAIETKINQDEKATTEPQTADVREGIAPTTGTELPEDTSAQAPAQETQATPIAEAPVTPEPQGEVVPYTPDTTLSPEHQTVETKFGKYLNENYDDAKKTYEKKFGNVLNTDNARELSEDYESNRALSSAVHEPSAAFIRKLYQEKLDEEWFLKGKENKVIFTAGGTGAGKTVSTRNSNAEDARIVYDGNLDHFESAKAKIDQAIDAGVKDVEINYTYREPVEAFENGVVAGMLSPKSGRRGRTVPIRIHAMTHLNSRENIEKLAKEYRDNDNVKITVIDNSRGKGRQKQISIDKLPKIPYTANELTKRLEGVVDKLYENGKITKAQYEGFNTGRVRETDSGGQKAISDSKRVPNRSGLQGTDTGTETGVQEPDTGTESRTEAEVTTEQRKNAEQSKESVPGVTDTGGTSEREVVKEPPKKDRKFATQVLTDPNVSKEVKKGLSDDAKTYIPKGVSITTQEANAIIEVKGEEQAMLDYLDQSNGMAADTRVVLGEALIRKFNETGDFDNAIKVADNLSRLFTDLGRAVNAAKVFSMLTPEGTLRYVQREKTKLKDKYSRKTAENRKRSQEEVDRINTEAVEKILNTPRVKNRILTEVKKGRVKQAIDFLETLKIDTKGKALSTIDFGLTPALWNGLITAVQKGLEAGLTLSQAINKAINKAKESKPKDFDEAGAREFFGEKLKDYRVTLDPQKAITEELKAQNDKIENIIREHYSVAEAKKRSLVEKLVSDANLPEPEATAIAKELSEQFDTMTSAAKEKALRKYLPKEKKKSTQRKDLVDEIVQASNLGALDEEQYRDAILKSLGPESITEAQASEIKKLADAVQKAKPGFDKNRATERLMTYVNRIEGVSWKDVGMAIWYANILSGLSTQVLNITANTFETMGEAWVSAIQNPKQTGWILGGLFQGWGRGYLEAMDTLQHGFQPSKFEQKIPSSPILESTRFKGGAWNPYNYLKYVTRIMSAADIFFYQGINEMRSRELAVSLAKKENRDAPNREIIGKAKDMIYRGENPFDESMELAKAEGWKGRDLKRRAYEILEQTRPEFIIKDSNDEAARGTFNYEPEGVLGSMTAGINYLTDKVDVMGVKPIKFIIPFTRIIANVTNRYLDWSPVGLIRAAKGGIGFETLGENKYRKYTAEERAKVMTKAITGMLGFAAMYALTDDDDGEWEITADGTGDTQKNFELQESGWRPYSIRVGDHWYEYKNTPLAIPFAILGYLRDAEKYKGDKDMEAKIGIVMFGTLKYVMDLSFLQALSSFFDTFSKTGSGTGDTFVKKSLKNVEQIGKSVVVPNAFTQVSRSVQEVMDLPIKRANSVGDQIIRDMPILRDHLGNIYDALGDPVVPNQMERFLPLKPSPKTDDRLWDLIIENQAWIGRPRRATVKPNGDSMTDEEFDKYALLAGQLTKKKLSTAYYRLSRMKDKSDVQDEIGDIKTDARREARDKLFGSLFF